jgi:serine/threonine protein kinase
MMGMRVQDEKGLRCLGQAGHTVSAEEVVCPSCGALVMDTQLGVYTVRQRLGQGRSGSAYLATHHRTQQPVALKLFPPLDGSVRLWEAARREVRVSTSLRHPAVLPIFSTNYWQPEPEQGTFKRSTCLISLCQYASFSLARFAAQQEQNMQQAAPEVRGRMLSRLLGLLRQVGEVLSVAHTRGLVHGALVPGNMLMDEHDHIWLADFGLARLHPPPPPFLAPELQAITQAGLQTGQVQRYWEAVTPASDQYSLSILCQQLFARLLPASAYELMMPALRCAANEHPGRRFASVDIFLHEMISLVTRSRQPSSGEWQGYNAWGTHETPLPSSSDFSYPGINTGTGSGINTRTSGPLSDAGQFTPVTPMPLMASAEDWERRGDKLFTMRDYDGALKAYQRALEVSPDNATTWMALGDTYFALEDYREALRSYERAMVLTPMDPQVWSNRGTALDALGRHKEAQDCYDRAEQLK